VLPNSGAGLPPSLGQPRLSYHRETRERRSLGL